MMKTNSAYTRITRQLALWSRRAKSRRQLLDLSERTLEDIGYSRALLEQGVGSWPWRIAEGEAMHPAIPGDKLSVLFYYNLFRNFS
jgi:uncharacterized protein YjiS (DUF1127 family)